MYIIYFMIASFIYWGAYTKQAKTIYRIGMLLLFVLTAFRDVTLGGTDATIYRNFFDEIFPINQIFGFQHEYTRGFILFVSIIKTFTSNYFVYQIIYTFFVFILLYIVIEKLEISDREKCIFLFTYFCFHFIWDFWVTQRQTIANLIIWITILSIGNAKTKKKKIMYGIIGIVIAGLFHSSGWLNLILLPVLFLISKIPLKYKKMGVPSLAIIIYLMTDQIYKFALNNITTFLDARYLMYSESTYVGGNAINFIFRLFFFIIFCFIYEYIEYENKEVILSALALMVLIGSINVELVNRVFLYYSFGLYTSMTLSYRLFSSSSRKIVAPIYGIGLMIILFRFIMITDNGLYMNYALNFCC